MAALILLMCTFLSCSAQDQREALFEQAQLLYNEGSYDAALEEYQKIPNKTGAIWYNMANTAYKLHDYTHALLYILRAQKYGDVQTYSIAYKKMNEIAASTGFIVQGYKESVMYYLTLFNKKIPTLVWQMLVLLIWYLVCYMLMKRRRISFLNVGIVSICMLLMLLPVIADYYNGRQNVLIIAESVDVFNGPNSALYKIGSLKKNTLAQLQEAKKQWYKISHAGIIGWIERTAAEKI